MELSPTVTCPVKGDKQALPHESSPACPLGALTAWTCQAVPELSPVPVQVPSLHRVVLMASGNRAALLHPAPGLSLHPRTGFSPERRPRATLTWAMFPRDIPENEWKSSVFRVFSESALTPTAALGVSTGGDLLLLFKAEH